MSKLTVEDMGLLLANPFYCLPMVHPSFALEHEPLVTRETWIKSAVRAINENGSEKFLNDLLDNLEGGFMADGQVPDGYKLND